MGADSASKLEEMQGMAGTWDGEKRKVSKHAKHLLQLNNGVKIPVSNWKCQKCDLKENLWLNLTDGSILCGRKFFDGSGGNNHALQHYEEFKYPLAVKLGTITSTTADVFSYDEDEMVDDPFLSKHLAHFGINIAILEKTDKSMIEIEIYYNQRIGEWAIIQEADSKLIPLFGPEFTGLANLGNSCYLNSVMQVIFSIPDFQKRYYPPNNIFLNSPSDPAQDFNTQMAKLAYGLLSGDYSKPPKNSSEETINDQVGIKPTMFKNLLGKGHSEFSTKRQQDAHEFFYYLINLIERNHTDYEIPNPTDCFKFLIEEKIQCIQTQKVTDNTRVEYILPLQVPLDKAINLKEVEEYEARKKASPNEKLTPVPSRILLSSCFDCFTEPEIIDDFFSTALNRKTTVKKTSKLRTFPDYLMLQIKKFTLDDNWTPKKLDISLDVPDIIDLSHLRGTGQKAGEELFQEAETSNKNEKVNETDSCVFDSNHISSLRELGFSIDACKRALYNTNNSGVMVALNWLLTNQENPELNAPFNDTYNPQARSASDNFVPDTTSLEFLKSMGIETERAMNALKKTVKNLAHSI